MVVRRWAMSRAALRASARASSKVTEGYAVSERLAFCDVMYPPTRIPFNVRQCSMYEDKRLPDFEEMKEFAWELRSKSAGAKAGFVLASELAKPAAAQEEKPAELPAAAKD